MREAEPIEHDPLDRLVEDCLERLDEGDAAGVEGLLGASPGLAPQARARLAQLKDMGLLEEPRESAPTPPERLGPFRILRRLGGGGMGVVYLAEQEDLGRPVALKLIRPDLLYFDRSRERFRREVEVVARLHHPGIVPVYLYGEEQGIPYYAMEFLEGASLEEVLVALRGRGPARLAGRDLLAVVRGDEASPPTGDPGRTLARSTWTEACVQMVHALAVVLGHAHRHRVLHRDLKPSNIMLTPDGRVVLLDFGLASTQDPGRLTRTGTQIGSLPYMAPEQLRDEPVDERTDVYALGVTLYELLTLRSPYLAATAEETRRRILDGAPPPMRALDATVSWDVETVCRTAMELDPARRYASADHLAADLRSVLERRPIAARRPGLALRVRRWVQRHPTRTVATVLGALLFIGGPSVIAAREHFSGIELAAARDRAQEEAGTREATLEFLNKDLLEAVRPDRAGRGATVRQVLDLAAARVDERFPDRPSVRASLHHTVGNTYRHLGELALAEHHLEAAFALEQELAGNDSLDAARVALSLALLRSDQGRLAEAERLVRDSYAVHRRELGDQHRDTLRAANDLGLVLTDLSRFAEAEPILRATYEGRARLLGADDPGTLITMSNVGKLYEQWGRFDLAADWTRREYEASLRVQGERHPETLISMNNWAVMLQNLGRAEESRALVRRAAELSVEVLGPTHPDAMARVVGLANRTFQTDPKEAERLLRGVLEQAGELGDGHPLIIRARRILAATLLGQGRAEEAEDAIAVALEGALEQYGDEHPATLDARSTYALIVATRGRTDEAIDLYEEALEYAPGAHDAFYHGQVLLLYARLLDRVERTEDAAGRYREAYAILEASFPRHDITAACAEELARLLRRHGQSEEAAGWQQRVDRLRADPDLREASADRD